METPALNLKEFAVKAFALSLLVFITACGGYSTTNPVPDEGTADLVSSDAEAEVSEDTSIQDTAVEDTAVEDTTVLDTTPPEDTSLPPSDGLLGAACESTSECAADYTCFVGYCTKPCKENGEPIPDACLGASDASIFGDSFGCPGDIGWCMPGAVGGKNVICSNNDTCVGFGDNWFCAGAVRISSKIVEGVCLPTGEERGVSGSPCLGNKDCRSFLCFGEDAETETEGECAAHCETNKHCQDNALCIGIGFNTGQGFDEATAWAGLCSSESGSLTYCNAQAKCPEGEVCEVFIEPSKLKQQYWCVAPDGGEKAVGESCTSASECASARCMLGGVDGVEGYCTNVCQKKPEDCPNGTTCGKLSLHNNGTPGEFNDDVTFGLCVYGNLEDLCSVNAQTWCTGELECEALGEAPEWLGQCAEPLTCDDPDGPTCEDALSCTVDACLDGECDHSELEAETCLIDGECYAEGDASDANPCQICASDVDALAWSDAPDSDLCEGGQPIPEPEPEPQPEEPESDVIEDVEEDVMEEVIEDAGPSEDVPPAEEDVPPAEEDVPPAEEDVPPAEEDVPPAEEDVPPAEEDVPPAEEDVPPVEEDVPPAEEDVPPAEEDGA